MAAPINSSHYDFMYPDLLSKDGLLFILRQRYISHLHDDLDSMDKESLVELYNRYILPLPQRAYKPNKRGIQMSRVQKLMDRKRKALPPDNGESFSGAKKARVQETQSGLVNQHSIPSTLGDRLKPPPSCVNFENKRIKLKSDVASSAAKRSEDAPIFSTSESKAVSLNEEQNVHTKEQTVLNEDSASPRKKKFVPISWP